MSPLVDDDDSVETTPLLKRIPGIRESVWSYDDDTGTPKSVSLTRVDGETVTVTDPAAVAALAFPNVQKENWRYDNTGAPESASITSVDGETVTVTDPTALATLAGR
jgi:predicted double-glycine peptidase